MKKGLILASLISVATVAGCSYEVPVTVDADKEIMKEADKIKRVLNSVPISHIEGAKRASVSIETNLGKQENKILFLGTDIVMHNNQEVLVSYVVSNFKREDSKKLYNLPLSEENKTHFTNEDKTGIRWEKDGWYFEMKPSAPIPIEMLSNWSNTFKPNPNLSKETDKWYSLDNVSFMKNVPGENVRFQVGMSIKNPEQNVLNKISNSLYMVIQTDIGEVKDYQINHAVIQKQDFNEEWVESFKFIKVGDTKIWYNKKKREIFWEDEHFVYHMQDNATKENVELFTLKHYLKFADVIMGSSSNESSDVQKRADTND